jgi:hypothetical protein
LHPLHILRQHYLDLDCCADHRLQMRERSDPVGADVELEIWSPVLLAYCDIQLTKTRKCRRRRSERVVPRREAYFVEAVEAAVKAHVFQSVPKLQLGDDARCDYSDLPSRHFECLCIAVQQASPSGRIPGTSLLQSCCWLSVDCTIQLSSSRRSCGRSRCSGAFCRTSLYHLSTKGVTGVFISMKHVAAQRGLLGSHSQSVPREDGERSI